MNRFYKTTLLLSQLFLLSAVCGQDLNPSSWPNLKGYWKFQNTNTLTKATTGNDLILSGSHQYVAGPSVGDTAIRIGVGSYYKCYHNIPPNGGGDSVNRYTLMYDFKVLSLNKWHTFHQTDTTNGNDGECFIRPVTETNPGRIGTATTGYTPVAIEPNKWYRLVISVNLGHHYRYYLNGDLVLEGDTQDVDDRFALNNHLLLFADNNQEDDTIDIASVAVFDTCLSTSDIAVLGTIDPCVLNPISLNLGGDTTLCGNNTISKSLGYGKYTYLWSTGDTAANLTFSIQKMGTGVNEVWVNKTDENGCQLSDTFNLAFYNSPAPRLGNDTSFCQGGTAKYNAGSALNNTFEWRILPLDSIVGKLNNITVGVSGMFTVKVTNQYGCSAKDTAVVTVHPKPVKPVLYTLILEICEGDTVTITSNQSYSRYFWNTTDTSSSLRAHSSGKYYLVGWNQFGCQSPVSDEMELTVHAPPLKPELKFTTDTNLCQGEQTLLYISAGNVSCNWNDGPGNTFRTVNTAGSFYLTVTNIYGCESERSNTLNVRVFPNPPKPEVDLIVGSFVLCPGDSAVFQSKTVAVGYEWKPTGSGRELTVKTGANVSLKHVNEYGCLSEESVVLGVVMKTRPQKPNIQELGKDSLLSNPLTPRYRWYVDGVHTNDTFRTIRGVNKSVYRVQNGNGWCWSELSDSFYYDHSGLTQVKAMENSLTIYPNPSSSIIHVVSNEKLKNTNAELRLIDMNGKIIDTFTYTLNQNTEIQMNVSHLAAGVYALSIKTDKGIQSARFVKE